VGEFPLRGHPPSDLVYPGQRGHGHPHSLHLVGPGVLVYRLGERRQSVSPTPHCRAVSTRARAATSFHFPLACGRLPVHVRRQCRAAVAWLAYQGGVMGIAGGGGGLGAGALRRLCDFCIPTSALCTPASRTAAAASQPCGRSGWGSTPSPTGPTWPSGPSPQATMMPWPRKPPRPTSAVVSCCPARWISQRDATNSHFRHTAALVCKMLGISIVCFYSVSCDLS